MPTAVITPVVQSILPDDPTDVSTSFTVPTSWANALLPINVMITTASITTNETFFPPRMVYLLRD